MGTGHKTNLLAGMHRDGVQNVRIQIKQAPDCSSEASCYSHKRVSCLELVDGADVEQLPVVHAIEHPCRRYELCVTIFGASLL